MRKIYLLLVFAILSFGCSAEDYEQQVKDTVNHYLEGMMKHQYTDGFRSKYASVVFHPYPNELGIHFEYSSIKEKLEEHPGINIVTKAYIDSINSSNEKVYPTQNVEEGELSYFVRVVFQTVAFEKSSGLYVLPEPVDVIEYFIMGKDLSDNKYKITDSYPDPANLFIDLSYALEKISLIGRLTETENIAQLEAALKSIKR